MLRDELVDILKKAQINTLKHQKLVGKLIKLYKKVSVEEFRTHLMKLLAVVILRDSSDTSYVRRSLRFISRFCVSVTLQEDKELQTHPFLTSVVEEVLVWIKSQVYSARHNSCVFLGILLGSLSDDLQLEVELLDKIESALIETVKEPKVAIRVEALSALCRLQSPADVDCPVMKIYIETIHNNSAHIRRVIVRSIALTRTTHNLVAERVMDVDSGVRLEAYRRCIDVGPRTFKIAVKHGILNAGFAETDENVKKFFTNSLLPAWLNAYDGKYLEILKNLNIIATVEDFIKFKNLSEKLLNIFFKTSPMNELIEVVPLTDSLVRIEELCIEVTVYWNLFIDFLRKTDGMEEYLKQVLPEMTQFCHYLFRVSKAKEQEAMDEWKYIEYQCDLLNLMDIADGFDFSDEVGRRTLYSLIMDLLRKNNFVHQLVKKMIFLARKCSSSINFFTNDICLLISDIRDSLADEPLTEAQAEQRVFEAAGLQVKINILQQQVEDSVAAQDYCTAHVLNNELMDLQRQYEKFQEKPHTASRVRGCKSEKDVLCRCLDILKAVLDLDDLRTLTPSLSTCKNEFVVPLITSNHLEVHWRVLRCLGTMCIIDKSTAEEYGKIIAIPVSTYRSCPIECIQTLVQPSGILTDIINRYGIEIVFQAEETKSSQTTMKRRLYNTESDATSDEVEDYMTFAHLMDIFLDMLDDERPEIRYAGVQAIAASVYSSCAVTSSTLCRIILKWFSPLTERNDQRLQVCLGFILEMYMKRKISADVLRDAIMPTLSAVANAPRTSPLADIEPSNIITFLATMVNLMLVKDDVRILALDICMKISESPKNRVVIYLSKLLCHLNVPEHDKENAAELIERVEMVAEVVTDKGPHRYLQSFLQKQRNSTSVSATLLTNMTEQSSAIDSANRSHELEGNNNGVLKETVFTNNSAHTITESQQVKRKKKRISRNCVVLLQKMDVASNNGCISRNSINSDETILHSILECSDERPEFDPDLTIQTPSSNSSKHSVRNMISETSDSDNGNGFVVRRSGRINKKRIL